MMALASLSGSYTTYGGNEDQVSQGWQSAVHDGEHKAVRTRSRTVCRQPSHAPLRWVPLRNPSCSRSYNPCPPAASADNTHCPLYRPLPSPTASWSRSYSAISCSMDWRMVQPSSW